MVLLSEIKPDTTVTLRKEINDPNEDPHVEVRFTTAAISSSPVWSLSGWDLRLVKLTPNEEFTLDEEGTHYVKVFFGTLQTPHRTIAPPPRTAENLATKGLVKAGAAEVIVGVYTKTATGITHITHMDELKFGGPHADIFKWEVMEKRGELFNGRAFFNAHGIQVLHPDGSKLCYIQWWTAGKGVECALHNHADSHFLEIHMCIVNGTVNGGRMESYEGEVYVKVPLPEGHEHGPFWLIDEKTGAPLKNDRNHVRYWYHQWAAGGGRQAFTDKGFIESYDLWVVYEMHVTDSVVAGVCHTCKEGEHHEVAHSKVHGHTHK